MKIFKILVGAVLPAVIIAACVMLAGCGRSGGSGETEAGNSTEAAGLPKPDIQAPSIGTNAGKNAAWTFICEDESGEPVPGVKIQVCSDSLCSLVKTDENGRAVYTGERFAYEIHVLETPEGYENSGPEAFAAEESGGETILKFEKR
ncbi:MAG: hypothetical protein Q4E57_09780 [Eubacteriales bacterium]|nr:hypothetical protein [Eubacteriales bacterium]